jgi:methyltransferase-like protein 6
MPDDLDLAFGDLEFLEEAFSPAEIAEMDAMLASRDGDMSKYWAGRLQAQAVKHWNEFYKNNKANFFKDRHYLETELPELVRAVHKYRADLAAQSEADSPAPVLRAPVLFEVGCGVGNALFPLMATFPELRVLGCDCSRAAIALIHSHALYHPDKISACVADITKPPLPFPDASADFATLIFVLSALAPEDIPRTLRATRRCLAPGGTLLVRDYAVYDMTMLRFKKGSRISDRFYRRGDGTRTYFFERAELQAVLREAGFVVEPQDVLYVRRTVTNRGMGMSMKRTWIHGKISVDPDWVDRWRAEDEAIGAAAKPIGGSAAAAGATSAP